MDGGRFLWPVALFLRVCLVYFSFAICMLIGVVCLIGCGAADSFAGMLVGRFFLGIGGCM